MRAPPGGGGPSAPLRPQTNSELAADFPELVNPTSTSPSRHDKSVSTAFKGGGLNSPVMSRGANNKRDLPTLQIGLTELTRSSPTNQCLICDRSSGRRARDEFFSFSFAEVFLGCLLEFGRRSPRSLSRTKISTQFEAPLIAS